MIFLIFRKKFQVLLLNELKIKLSFSEEKKIHERPIENVFAYDCYKRAYPEMMSMSLERLENGLNLLQKGLEIAGENAVIYAGMHLDISSMLILALNMKKNIEKSRRIRTKSS